MKIKQSEFDEYLYLLACWLTGGTFWFARILISTAIRKAIKD